MSVTLREMIRELLFPENEKETSELQLKIAHGRSDGASRDKALVLKTETSPSDGARGGRTRATPGVRKVAGQTFLGGGVTSATASAARSVDTRALSGAYCIALL